MNVAITALDQVKRVLPKLTVGQIFENAIQFVYHKGKITVASAFHLSDDEMARVLFDYARFTAAANARPWSTR